MSGRPEEWIGKEEGARLEFKREEAHDEAILASVVAFLNARGGKVVIGIDAPKGTAQGVTGVREPNALRDRLQNLILDRIDPPPFGRTEIEVVGTPPARSLVVVTVERSDALHALRRGASLSFFVREGDTNRALDAREVARRLGPRDRAAKDRDLEVAAAFLGDARRHAKLDDDRAIALVVVGTPSGGPLERERWREVRRNALELLSTEAPLDLRRNGWTFALWPHAQPQRLRDFVRLGRADPLVRFVEIGRTGRIWAAERYGPEDTGSRLARDAEGSEHLRILDLAIAEFATSVVRLAAHAWQLGEVRGDVSFAAGLYGRIGLRIASLEPDSRRWTVKGEPAATEPPLESGVLRVPAAELFAAPDAIARRLLSRLFAWTGSEGWESYWAGERFVPPS